ncbi:thermostable hemolysin [Pseudomonas sp. RIT-PI-S]|uniref:thermostable hemolysin n=1 Tax=Pseudomonas sp. RIT-PI-S TaxID=3035295 RepID=UPI0021D90DC5|nr:thermostable hemolysin [Pseudomonas sp. RIT-PI-S]
MILHVVFLGLKAIQNGSGAGKYLLNTVIKTLALHNYGLMVLTATEQVRHILGQIVTNLDDLGDAEPSRVKDPGGNWGTYYAHAPRVVVSRLTSPASWAHKPCTLVRPRTFALPASA